MTLNIHVSNTENIGDLVCYPSRYFPEFRDRRKDLRAVDQYDGSQPLIVGGGGLYHETLWRHLQELALSGSGKRVAWGVGHNMDSTDVEWPYWIRKFSLSGVRDFNDQKLRWVPCVSCMDPLFDDAPQPSQEAVLYEHHRFPPLQIDEYPSMTNYRPPGTSVAEYFKRVIEFLASARTVITTTYHGVYWATLLGRRVVTVPWSTRFLGFRYPPVLTTTEEVRPAMKEARVYPQALDECRAANMSFHADAVDLLGSGEIQ